MTIRTLGTLLPISLKNRMSPFAAKGSGGIVTGQVHLAECRYAWSGWRAEVTGNARVSARSAWV